MTTHAPITIVGFGDSITQATIECKREEDKWLNRLDARLQDAFAEKPLRVINAGIGGNTSREGLARIETDVVPHAPDIVLVEFGNDITQIQERHVELSEFCANYEAIRRVVQDELNARLILLTFPPIIDDWHPYAKEPIHLAKGGIDAHEELYREATRSFAAEKKIPLVELDHALREACSRDGTERYILPDGIHLTAEGNRIVCESVFPVVADCIKTLSQ